MIAEGTRSFRPRGPLRTQRLVSEARFGDGRVVYNAAFDPPAVQGDVSAQRGAAFGGLWHDGGLRRLRRHRSVGEPASRLPAASAALPFRHSLRGLVAGGDEPDRAGPVRLLLFGLRRRASARSGRSDRHRWQDLAPQPRSRARWPRPERFRAVSFPSMPWVANPTSPRRSSISAAIICWPPRTIRRPPMPRSSSISMPLRPMRSMRSPRSRRAMAASRRAVNSSHSASTG